MANGRRQTPKRFYVTVRPDGIEIVPQGRTDRGSYFRMPGGEVVTGIMDKETRATQVRLAVARLLGEAPPTL